jgi:catalase
VRQVRHLRTGLYTGIFIFSWGQAGTLVRKVMDDAARDRLVSNVVGHLKEGVTEPVLQHAFEYWRNIDKEIGDRIARGVNAS